jgi:hypothetical protein
VVPGGGAVASGVGRAAGGVAVVLVPGLVAIAGADGGAAVVGVGTAVRPGVVAGMGTTNRGVGVCVTVWRGVARGSTGAMTGGAGGSVAGAGTAVLVAVVLLRVGGAAVGPGSPIVMVGGVVFVGLWVRAMTTTSTATPPVTHGQRRVGAACLWRGGASGGTGRAVTEYDSGRSTLASTAAGKYSSVLVAVMHRGSSGAGCAAAREGKGVVGRSSGGGGMDGGLITSPSQRPRCGLIGPHGEALPDVPGYAAPMAVSKGRPTDRQALRTLKLARTE